MKLHWKFFTMIRCGKYWLLSFFALLFVLRSHAQEDARFWIKAGVKKKFTQKFDLEFASCLRLGDNYSRINSYYFQLSGEYELVKGVKIGLGARHAYRRKLSPEYHMRNRMSIWLDMKKTIIPGWELQYRPMYLRQYTDMYVSESGQVPTDYFRNKFGLQFKPKRKYSPFISCELYYRIRYDYNNFNRIRYTLGIDYRFDKYNKITLSYRIQKRMNEKEPLTAYILIMEYGFVF